MKGQDRTTREPLIILLFTLGAIRESDKRTENSPGGYIHQLHARLPIIKYYHCHYTIEQVAGGRLGSQVVGTDKRRILLLLLYGGHRSSFYKTYVTPSPSPEADIRVRPRVY